MKTRLTLKPGQKGTKQLTDKYGDALLCIRFRYDDETGKRFKTVELIVEQTDWIPPPPRYDSDILVPLRIDVSNFSLRAKVKAAGGKWFPEELLWYVKYGAIVGGPLEKHIYVDYKNKFKKHKKHL
ncbi:MAG: hypothetical protein PHF56_12815 [Desulfuromonadaceae bacterium]|nr:hypothetical protein [Desulfuromonadaceae bacterium]